LQFLHKELKSLQREKDKLGSIVENNSQNKLKSSKFRALFIIKKALNSTKLEKNETILENRDYEKEISNAKFPEEVEAIREEVLLRIAEKFPERRATEKTKANYSNNLSPTSQNNHQILEKLIKEISKTSNNNKKDSIKDLKVQLIKLQEQNDDLKNQLSSSHQNSIQAKDLQNRFQILEEQTKNSN